MANIIRNVNENVKRLIHGFVLFTGIAMLKIRLVHLVQPDN